eukprot:CAMPEP_0181065516 /NCGR_PEP_ID=MMETSP1070-20121207/24775_1 /TAXON_ID=265543 /ORGANISM="Minutocellus polymorphus, Strain NH13" /LENGTH=697 /DNA_ID=CAMNT_0023145901 /DNA_START=183 /DNA_END=2276 /DNA_ORIENTATION=-
MSHPLLPLQSLVHTSMEDFALDYSAMHKAFQNSLEPASHLVRRRLKSRKDATSQLLSAAAGGTNANSFVVVTPSDRTKSAYTVDSSGGDDDYDEDDDEAPAFDNNNVKMESTLRHPGTTTDSDVEDGVDPSEKFPYFNINKHTSPITTVAAEHLYGLVFAGAGGIVSELKASYPMQLSARIDESRRALNLDCFEYKPKAVDMKAKEGDSRPIPTYGDMKKFEDSFDLMSRNEGRSGWESDEESLDPDEDEEMREQVKPREGITFDDDDVLRLNYRAVVGNFANSRCLRVRIPLDEVVGIRLIGKTSGEESDNGVVLVLEISEKLEANAFVARKVHAKYHRENSFAVVDDWTPNKVASRSSRFYLYGNLTELKQAAALMAKLCPHLAIMLSSSTSESNTLRASASVDYASSSEFINNDNKTEGKPPSKKQKVDVDAAKGYKMSVNDVHQLLVDTNLLSSKAGAERVNPCLKRAILMGHIKIDKSTTKSTVIHTASCCNCGESGLECTIGDAMEQVTYAGLDYEEGGEGAEVKCKDCGSGNYITEICTGNKNYDSGKFHNHCCECDDFGVCIRDYREAHCRHCGEHYFRGNMGFPCPSCGDGKSKDIVTMPPPSPSVWDGMVADAKEVFLTQLKGKNRFEAMMARAMVLGPSVQMGSDMEGPGIASVISQMASHLQDGEEEEGGPDGEGGAEDGECTIM